MLWRRLAHRQESRCSIENETRERQTTRLARSALAVRPVELIAEHLHAQRTLPYSLVSGQVVIYAQ